MSRFVETLVSAEMANFNPSVALAFASLLVLKVSSVLYRFTVDLRSVNHYTLKHQFSMPSLESELAKLSTSRYFALLELSHGYWQISLVKASLECQSFTTPDGIHTPTRVLHGMTNAIMYPKTTLAALMPDELRSNNLWRLDDVLVYLKSVLDHLSAVSLLLSFCAKYNFKLHPGKFTVFATTIHWCGRLISSDGMSSDPRPIGGTRQITQLVTEADLQ